jgi:hypothetical protein
MRIFSHRAASASASALAAPGRRRCSFAERTSDVAIGSTRHPANGGTGRPSRAQERALIGRNEISFALGSRSIDLLKKQPLQLLRCTPVECVITTDQLSRLAAGSLHQLNTAKESPGRAGASRISFHEQVCGHDIAQDLHSAGAKVTLVQRSSTMIVNALPSLR